VETPNIQVFANELDNIRTRDELIERIKAYAMERGFNLVLPYG
jgi:hypothetical protein